ncbi:RES family NAD+ phosphorylase [Xanthovirga aplysinae]|uniref:RES family NAD+ phosphorylase n=1 Tax=Xanthovirga aplysinae TaxID=2529853 RepID=UPI0012BCBFCE|nr:RES family NAD+ phosphorylase [Xanthovirga aplysinae]MTI32085.1 RES domain-containing protein [Xanthovirga aplysinae]
MIIYRLCKKEFSQDLSGRGAELAGGRWNSKGTPMVYCCESRALCTAEVAVHLPLGIIPSDFTLLTISLPDHLPIFELETLPKSWNKLPPAKSTKLIGDQYIKENKYLIFKAPSTVVLGDYNYLLNPRHPDFKKVEINKTEPFQFDPRLFV